MSSTSGAAASGDAVAYAAQGQFAGIGSGAPQGQYRSVRRAGRAGRPGESTRRSRPRPVSDAVAPSLWILSEDLSQAVVSTNVAVDARRLAAGRLVGPVSPGQLRVRHPPIELLSVPPSPALRRSRREDPLGSSRKLRFSFSGASSDFRHVVFEAERPAAHPRRAADRAGPLSAWSDGQVRFVSELPSGEPGDAAGLRRARPGRPVLPRRSRRLRGWSAGLLHRRRRNVLYVREHGTTTTTVSARPMTIRRSPAAGHLPGGERPTTDRARCSPASPS